MNLDREALRQVAAERRADGKATPKTQLWPCEFCKKNFVTETGFMNHKCEARARLDELRSPRGQAAYSWYSEWMRAKKRSVPSQETFQTSRQYKHFLKFVDWSEKTAIPNVPQFIKLMVQSETEPVLWCRDTTFGMYLQWYDNVYPPEQQFIETFDALTKLAEEHGVPLNQVYTALGPASVSKLVRRRKLSPWLLACSPRFLNWVKNLDALDREQVTNAVNFGAFASKIQEAPALAAEFRAACKDADV